MNIEYNCPHCKTKSTGRISEFTIKCDDKLKELAENRNREYEHSENIYITTLREFKAAVVAQNKNRTLIEKLTGVLWVVDQDILNRKYLQLKKGNETIESKYFSRKSEFEDNLYNYILCPVCNKRQYIP